MSLDQHDQLPVASGPLAGLRVLDCSHGTAGPRATGLLADYGAEVVWVERPGGDPLRRRDPASVSAFGRAKRSITVDLTDEAEREALLEATADFDVFIESWQPGVASRLGLGYEALAERNPALVYCSISGFGETGRFRDVPGYEAVVHALVGTMADQPGHREGPIFQGLPFASMGAAYLAVIGVLAALYRRHIDGRGRRVETSLFDGALAYHSMLWGETDESVAGRGPATLGGRQGTKGTRMVTRTYECADGLYIGVHTGAVGAFGRLMHLLGLDDRIPSSADGMDIGQPLTPDQQKLLDQETFRLFLTEPRSHWVEKLMKADVCAVEHLHPTEVFDQAQARHNGMVIEIDDSVLGRVEQVAPAAKFGLTPAATPTPAPRAGEEGVGGSALPKGVPWMRRGAAPASEDMPVLEGVTILDLGAYYAGPYSSRLLADLGAEVIKLEPTRGDQLRGMERPFFSAQAGKRSIAADLKAPETAPIVRRLLEGAEIVHHNLRPGAAERLGLDYESVRETNPEVIYLYAPGWGSTGPHRTRQSFAPMLSGFVGVTFEVAGRYNEPMPSSGNEDPGNGLLGAAAMLMGLLVKQRSGKGQYIENPQLNATMAHMAHVVRNAAGEAVGAGRLDTVQYGFSALERLYPTTDGWICLVAVNDRDLAAVAKVAGVEILGDPRFADEGWRLENDFGLSGMLEEAFGRRSTNELLSELWDLGVAAVEPVGPNVHSLLNEPDHRLVGRVVEVSHPRLGRVREIGVLVRVSGSVPLPHRLAPELGEHTGSILADLGFDERTVEALRESGAVK